MTSASTGDNTTSTGDGSSTGVSVAGLTAAMKQLKDSKPPDLKLSAEARKNYTTMISDYRVFLQNQRKLMDDMDDLGNPGTFESAKQTKANLLTDINGPSGIKDTIDKCIDYLDELQATVGNAGDALLHAG